MSKPKFQTLVILLATLIFCGLVLLIFPSLRNTGWSKYVYYAFALAFAWEVIKSFIFLFQFDD